MTLAQFMGDQAGNLAVLAVQGAMLLVVREELKQLRADVRSLRESWAAKFGETLKGGGP